VAGINQSIMRLRSCSLEEIGAGISCPVNITPIRMNGGGMVG